MTLPQHMSIPSQEKRTSEEQTASREAVKAALLQAAPGEKRKSKDDLKHGFRVFSDGKQSASAYFSDNAPCNQVEFALNFRLFEEDSRLLAEVRRWLENRKKRLGNRDVNVHQRGDPVDWFRIGFTSVEQALEFLEQLRSERRRFDRAARWRIPDEHQLTDSINTPGTEPLEDSRADCSPGGLQSGRRDRLHGAWMATATRMVTTAAQTILQSNGEAALKRLKPKQNGFESQEQFERYVIGLIEMQGARCAISGLPLQRDDACTDSEMLASLDRVNSDGDYAPDNLQVVCRFINRWKGADDNALFVRLLDELRHGSARKVV